MKKAFMGICDAYVPRLSKLGLSDQMLEEWEWNIANGKWICGGCYTFNEITMFWQRSLKKNGITQSGYNSVGLDDIMVTVFLHPIPLQQQEYQVCQLAVSIYLWSRYSAQLLRHMPLWTGGKLPETNYQDQLFRMHLAMRNKRCHMHPTVQNNSLSISTCEVI